MKITKKFSILIILSVIVLACCFERKLKKSARKAKRNDVFEAGVEYNARITVKKHAEIFRLNR